jgi:hypothetical protein
MLFPFREKFSSRLKQFLSLLWLKVPNTNPLKTLGCLKPPWNLGEWVMGLSMYEEIAGCKTCTILGLLAQLVETLMLL